MRCGGGLGMFPSSHARFLHKPAWTQPLRSGRMFLLALGVEHATLKNLTDRRLQEPSARAGGGVSQAEFVRGSCILRGRVIRTY